MTRASMSSDMTKSNVIAVELLCMLTKWWPSEAFSVEESRASLCWPKMSD